MQTMKSALIAAASVGAMLAVLGTGPAAAAPVDFTWNPSLTGGATKLSTATAFTADRITTSDYATIQLGAYDAITNSYDSVSEHAIIPVTQFSLSGNPLTLPGLDGQAGATKYQMYFVVTATSALTVNSPTSLSGEFTSLNYSLMGYAKGNCSYSANTTAATASCSGGTPLVLATGSLTTDGINQVSINSGVPSANADANVVGAANTGGFFVSPSNLALIEFKVRSQTAPGHSRLLWNVQM